MELADNYTFLLVYISLSRALRKHCCLCLVHCVIIYERKISKKWLMRNTYLSLDTTRYIITVEYHPKWLTDSLRQTTCWLTTLCCYETCYHGDCRCKCSGWWWISMWNLIAKLHDYLLNKVLQVRLVSHNFFFSNSLSFRFCTTCRSSDFLFTEMVCLQDCLPLTILTSKATELLNFWCSCCMHIFGIPFLNNQLQSQGTKQRLMMSSITTSWRTTVAVYHSVKADYVQDFCFNSSSLSDHRTTI